MLNGQIIRAIEAFAPKSLQESWDNTGLQVGTLNTECTGVLVCFDVTPEVVEQAIALGYNLIVSHHPLFFRPVKRLTGETPQQVCAINAIAAGVTIYSTHTAIDSARGGVSYILAEKLGIEPLRVLDPLSDRMVRLQVMVPDSDVELVRSALFDAGAGAIGDYDCCSFNVSGYGTFRAKDGANPHVGEIGENHTEAETEVSVVLTRETMDRVERALIEVHPYEEPAYQFTPMLNRLKGLGLGIYGTLESGMGAKQLVDHVKTALGCSTVRTTPLPLDHDTPIRRVAVCGGAGHSYIDTAIAMGADAYITADLSYHDFVDYQGRILLIDAGHYETECSVKEAIAEIIRKSCPGLPAIKCTESDNPVRYL